MFRNFFGNKLFESEYIAFIFEISEGYWSGLQPRILILRAFMPMRILVLLTGFLLKHNPISYEMFCSTAERIMLTVGFWSPVGYLLLGKNVYGAICFFSPSCGDWLMLIDNVSIIASCKHSCK